LNRQSRAERQNTFDWLYILPVRVTISQYKSYSANGSHILPVQVIFCQWELYSAIMFCRNYLQFNRQFCSALSFCSALPIQYTLLRHLDGASQTPAPAAFARKTSLGVRGSGHCTRRNRLSGFGDQRIALTLIFF